MRFPASPLIAGVHPPPISEVKGWLAGAPEGLPLIDLCQAIPDYPPPRELTDHLSQVMLDPHTSRYSIDEGLLEVREAVCAGYRELYGACIDPSQLILTIGASQAFWLAMVTLCRAGDEVIVQLPAYFDHPMALEMLGVRCVYAPFEEENAGLPDPAAIAALITDKTRAILLVTPSNPTGAVIPPETVRELHRLAVSRDIAWCWTRPTTASSPGEPAPTTSSRTRTGGTTSSTSPPSARPSRSLATAPGCWPRPGSS